MILEAVQSARLEDQMLCARSILSKRQRKSRRGGDHDGRNGNAIRQLLLNGRVSNNRSGMSFLVVKSNSNFQNHLIENHQCNQNIIRACVIGGSATGRRYGHRQDGVRRSEASWGGWNTVYADHSVWDNCFSSCVIRTSGTSAV